MTERKPVAIDAVAERPARWERPLRLLVMAAAGLVMLLFLVTALRRLRYPYELEQLEGYMFLSALRVFHGQALYPRPSLEFVPYMYPPVYYYACAALGHLIGMGMATLRAVSLLSTLGCFAVIYALVRREVRQHLPAVAAAGLYAGCYALRITWFDMGRLDALFVLTLLLALYATRWWHPAVAALFWTLCFQTKQSILPAAFVLLCFQLGRTPQQLRRTLIGVGALAAGAAGSVLWLNHATQGWYSFYVFTLPRANADLGLRAAFLFWPDDLLRPLALAMLVIVAGLLFTRPAWHSPATRFYLAACSLVPLFWWIRTHSGSTVNALMPVDALVAVLFGVAVGRLLQRLRCWPRQYAQPALQLVLWATLAQQVAGVYNPGSFRPNQQTESSMAAVVAQVHALPGDVLVPLHPYYAYLAGKPVQADYTSLRDAMRASPSLQAELRAQWLAAFATHRYAAVVLDSPEQVGALDALLGGPAWRQDFSVQYAIPHVWTGMRPYWILEPAPHLHPAQPHPAQQLHAAP